MQQAIDNGNELDVADAVRLNGRACGYMRKWLSVLANRPGASMLSCIERAEPPRATLRWRPQSDAAVGDVHPDGRAGLGGYLYGYYWTFATLAPITIPVAEFVAAIFNIIIFEPLLAAAQCVVLEIDAIATPTILSKDSARSAGLREALREARELPAMQRMRNALMTRHCFGEGNTAADAASRAKWGVLASIAEQLGHRLRRVEVPPEAVAYLNRVLAALNLGEHVAPSLEGEAPPPGPTVALAARAGDAEEEAEHPLPCQPGEVHTDLTRVQGAELVRCDHTSPLGNPWPVGEGQDICRVCDEYEALLQGGGDARQRSSLRIDPRFDSEEADARREACLAALEQRLRSGRSVQLACARACSARRRADPQARCHIFEIATELRARSNPTNGDPAAAGGPAIRHMLRMGDGDSPPARAAVRERGHGALSCATPESPPRECVWPAPAHAAASVKRELPSPPPQVAPKRARGGSGQAQEVCHTPPLPVGTGVARAELGAPPAAPSPEMQGAAPRRMPSGAPSPAVLRACAPEDGELLDAVAVPPPCERLGYIGTDCDDEADLFSRAFAARAQRATGRVLAARAAASTASGRGQSRQAQRVAEAMAESMRADSSRYALRPADSSVIDVACLRLVNLLQGHAPQTTRANEASNWKHWLAFCAHMNTSPWRDDAAANAGGEGHEREINVLALGLLYIYARMQPAKRSPNTPPKPASALAVLRGVRRLHKRMGYKMVDLTLVVRLAAALAEEYALEHGPELLQSKRTEPLTNSMVAALVNARDGPLKGGGAIDSNSLRDVSLRACFATMARTGFRADEVALRSGAEHTLKRLSRWHLRWRIAGVPMAAPSAEQLRSLAPGDFAILIPPTSKADQFGLEWGPNPIYLRYDPGEEVNAARELRDLELRYPLEGDARRAHALFIDGSARPLRQDALREAFKARLLTAGFAPAEVEQVSLHSFRVYLACCLLELKRSHDEIKALLRWKSDEAIRVYARLNADSYANLLTGVGTANVDSMRSHNLAQATTPAEQRAGAILAGRAAFEQAGMRADARDADGGDDADIEPAEEEVE